jgi:hypothetical protein
MAKKNLYLEISAEHQKRAKKIQATYWYNKEIKGIQQAEEDAKFASYLKRQAKKL